MNFYNEIERQNEGIIHSLRVMLYNRDENVFEKIDFENENIYKEPLLFTLVNDNKDFWFDSITIKYQNFSSKHTIQVLTNNIGIIYLPNFGYLVTNSPNTTLNLIIENKINFKLILNERNIPYIKEELLYLDCGIEIIKHYHPILDKIFIDNLRVSGPIETSGLAFKHIESLNAAFSILKNNNKILYNALLDNLKKIMLFKSKNIYSFATLMAHNMIFLNVKQNDSVIFFIEHITHEGSHVLFNTLTFESKHKLFKVPYKTSFKEVSGIDWEHGDLYSRFHGLFTFSEIANMLYICYSNNVFKGEKLHELKGRLLFILERYDIQLKSYLSVEDVITKDGKKWLNHFFNTYKRIINKVPNLKNQISTEGQPYDFDFEIFIKNNPYS